MKLRFSLLALLTLLLFACQKENDLALNEQNILAAILENQASAALKINPPFSNQNNEAEEFERNLHWASFLAAKILCLDFVQEEWEGLAEGQDAIALDLLVGTNNIAPNFNRKFQSEALYYIDFIADLGHPEPNEDIPPASVDSLAADTAAMLTFIAYLIDENCVELFFPNELNFSPTSLTITSTAHPLNLDPDNNGYKRHCEPVSVDGEAPIHTTRVNVDQAYVDKKHNVIVARPYYLRIGVSPCTYVEYHEMDFTLFLNR